MKKYQHYMDAQREVCSTLVMLDIFTYHTLPQILSNYLVTVKLVLSGHSKIDKTRMLMVNDTLMQVENIAECSEHSAKLLTCIKQ